MSESEEQPAPAPAPEPTEEPEKEAVDAQASEKTAATTFQQQAEQLQWLQQQQAMMVCEVDPG